MHFEFVSAVARLPLGTEFSNFKTFNNFGCVSLSLNPTYPEDEGTYTCVLRNLHGQAESAAQLTTVHATSLLLESKHEQALAQIGYLEEQRVCHLNFFL